MLLGSGHHRKNESCYWLLPHPPLPTAHPKAPDSTAPPFPFLQLLLLTASCPPPLLPICSCIHPSIHPSEIDVVRCRPPQRQILQSHVWQDARKARHATGVLRCIPNNGMARLDERKGGGGGGAAAVGELGEGGEERWVLSREATS